jgi:hypothetical protein
MKVSGDVVARGASQSGRTAVSCPKFSRKRVWSSRASVVQVAEQDTQPSNPGTFDFIKRISGMQFFFQGVNYESSLFI